MGLEAATHISGLVTTNPIGATDTKSQGDDHLRLIKNVLKTTFPNASKAFRFPESVTKTANYVILATDDNKLLVGDATTAAFSFTLPTLLAADAGYHVRIVKSDATANALTVVGTISGETNYSITRSFEFVEFEWSGTAWFAKEPDIPVPLRVLTKTATGPVDEAELGSVILCRPTADMVLALPVGAAGDWVYVKRIHATFTVTLNPATTTEIEEDNVFVLENNHESVLVMSTGVEWFILAHYAGDVLDPPSQPTSSATNLVIFPHATTPNTKISITADEMMLVAPTGETTKHLAVSLVIDSTTTGANGCDVGTREANKEYYIWAISDGTTVSGIIHKDNLTAPTMPAGYDRKKLIGYARTDGSSNFLRIRQHGNQGQYIVGTNPSVAPLIDFGLQGTYSFTSPVTISASLAGLVPLNAKSVLLMAQTNREGNGPHGLLVAPNADWDGTNRGPIGSAGQPWPLALVSGVHASASVEMLLETLAVHWAGEGAGSRISVLGWRITL